MKLLKILPIALVSVSLYAITPFANFDKNNDGVVTEDEFYATQGENMSQRAEQGKMMKNASNAPAFTDIDANNDGEISPDELKDFQYNRMMNNKGKGTNR
ncbi:MAG: EF-hand domain-containing protein [Campylobacterales bacterium]|nr:EF-hand domain-containing protein [Campylobacterales bacterium]